ncbi:phytoene/squalene synthase family protein [Antrihabitans cavernicola]|uniref:Phytoene/squalene synthase family protein n=1 Tax=Antrihabitans cavernicola TaxID=2495913 RepID=A0A5A7SEQ1_9NOCA|nr:phytoene/squalene synthase family protein [Spelaeibacter cavernicola]KAA0023123.1 phytoene/squalene synthase family protein [Spelaeibacter cavernicola]
MTITTADDAELRAAYQLCRQVAQQHGRTYFLATRLLPAERRSATHALYAFARTVDDIVDVDATATAAAELAAIEHQLRDLIESGTDPVGVHRPVLIAVVDTIERFDIAPQYFWSFFESMRMDLPGTAEFRSRYATMADLRLYTHGSAAVIGLQMLPVLGTVVPIEEAVVPAAALGEAFQLTNFIRDVGEDLDRGRVYLPADELAAFDVDDALLLHCKKTGTLDRRVRRALAHFAAVNRSIYREARPGIDMLDRRVRPGIRAAFTLYAGILESVERNDFHVLDRRAVVPRSRRLSVASPELLRALAARRPSERHNR